MTALRNADDSKSSSLSADASVTQWIAGLKHGKVEAVDRLWHRYFPQLVRLARRKLGSAPRRTADEEDVAATVFRNLWQGAELGKFPDLRNRDNLWSLLLVLTSRRVCDLIRHEKRRGGDAAAVDDLDQLLAAEPTPEYAAMTSENLSRLFSVLKPDLRQIAQHKLEGRDNAEIARDMDCSLRTIERKLQLIRRTWDESR